MRKAVAVVAFLSLLGSCALAQINTDSHVVTVTVGETAWLGLSDQPGGGPLDVLLPIIIDPATGTGTATDSSTRLDWGTNGSAYKITLQELMVNDGGDGVINYGLTVTPTGLTRVSGVNAGVGAVITLDGAAGAKDFITGIDTAIGTCVLRYDASAVTADGTQTESRTVQYTITK
jgi:hypothetical protein